MIRRHDAGLALILVMTVVLALAIIATPFVLSMILQERTATTARFLSQADYGADGAKNYALWRLMLSLDPVERRSPNGVNSSYFYDTAREFDVRLDEQYLSRPGLQIADPMGSIWGVSVQDEQGKLNTRTCNPEALENLSRMVDARVVNLKDYLTMYSGRDATWGYPQRIRAAGYEKGTSTGGQMVVDNWHVLGKGSRVRVSKGGMKPMETRISSNQDSGGGGTQFSTEDPIQAYMDGIIEVEMRHPLNVNTAKRETLMAMFEGLHFFGRPQSRVDRQAAMSLATHLYNRDFRRFEQFFEHVMTSSLSGLQKAAVVINSLVPSEAHLDGSGTVPVCFASYDTYTVEAASSMNNAAGTQVAGRGYREVVSVSPPSTLRRYCESQYDFAQSMSKIPVDRIARLLNAVDPNLASMLRNFPYGGKILSFPRTSLEESDTAIKPQQRPGPNGNEAYVTVRPSYDARGESPNESMLTGWPDPHARDHFSQEMDGKKMSGPVSYDWQRFFTLNQVGEDEFNPANQRPDVGSGGFEVWTYFDQDPGAATIFDIREDETTNRVTLAMEGTDLVLTAADSTIPYTLGGDPDGRIANGVAQIRWPNFRIAKETWTHFSAHWKSTRYADLALLVDGFSDKDAKFMHYTRSGGDELMTKLGGAMSATSTTVTLAKSSIMPAASELSPILVGEEVILYDAKGGTVVRGARNTTAIAHPTQANVSLFGYSSKLRTGSVRYTWGDGHFEEVQYSNLPATTAKCKYRFGANPQATVAGDKQDPMNAAIWQIDATQASIGVYTGDITDFPDAGYIVIEDEIIFYAGRSTGGMGGAPPGQAKFTGCIRGQLGTTAAIHRSLPPKEVRLWSVAVTDFAKFGQNAIFQIDDEWFGPVKQQPGPNGDLFWTGFYTAGKIYGLLRGLPVFLSIPGIHSNAADVIPTFLGSDTYNFPCRGHSMGAGDRVTLTDGSNQKISARIQRTNPPPQKRGDPPYVPDQNHRINQATQIAAFTKPMAKDWTVDDLYTRVLKFPSGELLGRPYLDTGAQVTIGPVAGQIDELKAFAMWKGRLRTSQQLQPGSNSFPITPVGWTVGTDWPLWENGGLMKIGDEYVGYGRWNAHDQPAAQIQQAKRGWLNSAEELHDQGDSIFFMPWMSVSSLSQDVSEDDKTIRLNRRLGDASQYTSGYVLLDNEMAMFQWNDKDGRDDAGKTLSMPPRWDGQKGLYRGSFGTQATSHSKDNCLAYGMPFRYWDTYKAREFDNTMVWFQWGVKMDLAHWKTFTWKQTVQNSDPNVIVHALARVDNRCDFWDAASPGMKDPILLIDSITPNTDVQVKRTSYLQEAGQFDVRFLVEYKRDVSFDATLPRQHESWKRAPKITEIQVEYERPTQTLHHEDR